MDKRSASSATEPAKAGENTQPRTIQVPAIFSGFSSRADGGATMRFATNELNETDFMLLKRMHNSFGYLLFRANQFAESEVPEDDAPSDEERTPSQRLRAALYVWWMQQGEKDDFENFYRTWMEKAINRVKRVLD